MKRLLLVLVALFAFSASWAADCTSGQEPYSVTLSGSPAVTGTGTSPSAACTAAQAALIAADGNFNGGTAEVSGTTDLTCTVRKPTGGVPRQGSITQVCTVPPPPTGDNADVVAKLELIRLQLQEGQTVSTYQSPAYLLQMIYWTLAVFLFAHGYTSGNRLV